MPAVRSRTKSPVFLKITYIGATEAKAVNALTELPNVELRISLEEGRTRLHAKAWIFNQIVVFGTAFSMVAGQSFRVRTN